MIDGAGHYVNEAVAKQIKMLKEGWKESVDLNFKALEDRDYLRTLNTEIRKAVESVLEASDEFRVGMGPEWQGDPLTDACDELRAVLAEGPARHADVTDNASALGRLWDTIVRNTQGDLFWVGEILLAEIEKETGYSKARSLEACQDQ
jgi:hypothetical protein